MIRNIGTSLIEARIDSGNRSRILTDIASRSNAASVSYITRLIQAKLRTRTRPRVLARVTAGVVTQRQVVAACQ